jgi:hypothetical protein
MDEKLINGLGLTDLWKSMSGMDVAQLIAVVVIIALVLSVFLVIIFKKQLVKYFNSKSDNNFSGYAWPSEEIINIHNTPDKLSLTKIEAEEYKKMLLHKIDYLRNEKVTGKQFIINMEHTVYMSEVVRSMFKALAENSINLNIVRLIYVIPAHKKSKVKTDMDKFFLEIDLMAKKYNKPGSWAVKIGLNKKKFYEV